MHSITNRKASTGNFRRLTPYLITAGVGLSMATSATASPDTDEAADTGSVEIPAPTIDSNGDGVADAWDRSGDGQADAWDTNGDGKPDAMDDDADGKPDR